MYTRIVTDTAEPDVELDHVPLAHVALLDGLVELPVMAVQEKLQS